MVDIALLTGFPRISALLLSDEEKHGRTKFAFVPTTLFFYDYILTIVSIHLDSIVHIPCFNFPETLDYPHDYETHLLE